MRRFTLFLSVVLVVRNQAHEIESLLREITDRLSHLVSDYELVVIDNASEDDSVATLKKLTGPDGLPNLQVFALTKMVDWDTASWVGLENALGDFIALVDPLHDDLGFLETMLEKATHGVDVVLAYNTQERKRAIGYRIGFAVFSKFYRWFSHIHLAKELPKFRILRKQVVSVIMQHPMPALTYRHLPALCGFSRVNLSYSAPFRHSRNKSLGESIDLAVRLIVSTTPGPMRLVTTLSMFGAMANLLYSVYVIAIAVLKNDVAPGWVTLSLQQSGMFLLISLVLLILGEYILQIASLSNAGPAYHVAQEFTSFTMKRREKLNVEEAGEAMPGQTGSVPSFLRSD